MAKLEREKTVGQFHPSPVRPIGHSNVRGRKKKEDSIDQCLHTITARYTSSDTHNCTRRVRPARGSRAVRPIRSIGNYRLDSQTDQIRTTVANCSSCSWWHHKNNNKSSSTNEDVVVAHPVRRWRFLSFSFRRETSAELATGIFWPAMVGRTAAVCKTDGHPRR